MSFFIKKLDGVYRIEYLRIVGTGNGPGKNGGQKDYCVRLTVEWSREVIEKTIQGKNEGEAIQNFIATVEATFNEPGWDFDRAFPEPHHFSIHRIMEPEPMYMNVETGTVGPAREWIYENESGELVDAVELGEVVEVVKNEKRAWVEA